MSPTPRPNTAIETTSTPASTPHGAGEQPETPSISISHIARMTPTLPRPNEAPVNGTQVNLPRIPRAAMVRPHLQGAAKGRHVADIFDELNSDFRAERMRQVALRLAIPGIILVLLVGAGVAGWQVWRSRQAQANAEVAVAYAAAARDTARPAAADGAATPARAAAQTEFDRLAGAAPEGYRTLARLRAAALRAGSGDLAGALTGWDAVASDSAADPLLRDIARLLAAQHQVDAGDPSAVEARLQPLLEANSPWRPMAQETQALLALRTGHAEQAKDLLHGLSTDPAAPEGVRGRANAMLTQLGEAPPPPPGASR